MIQAPKVNIFDLGIKEKYSGEIKDNKFCFTWSRTMGILPKGKPIVKGQILKFENETKIDINIKDNSIYAIIVFALIMSATLIYFALVSISNNDYEGLKVVIGIFIGLVIVTALNILIVKKQPKIN